MESDQAEREVRAERKSAGEREQARSVRLNESLVMGLQRSIGNRAVGQFLTSKSVAKTKGVQHVAPRLGVAVEGGVAIGRNLQRHETAYEDFSETISRQSSMTTSENFDNTQVRGTGAAEAARPVPAQHVEHPRPVLQRACDCQGSCVQCAGKRPVEIPDESTLAALSLQRVPTETQPEDPSSLTGSPFAVMDPQLQAKLKDRDVFSWGTYPTLKVALHEQSNGSIAVMSRIGAMISATAPWLWDHVAKIGGNGWVTDNFGMGFTWKDGAALARQLRWDVEFCKDNPHTAQKYHGTTDAFRQIGTRAGTATMHIITSGRTEVHIDAHQPVEGKETNGSCNYDLTEWMGHIIDVEGGGSSGANGTAVGRYAGVYSAVDAAKKDQYYRSSLDDADLDRAVVTLKTVGLAVQRYAAMGKMVGNEWEGDRAMLRDAPTMAVVSQAELMVRQVREAQSRRSPLHRWGMPFQERPEA
jgi:hypothetical protein